MNTTSGQRATWRGRIAVGGAPVPRLRMIDVLDDIDALEQAAQELADAVEPLLADVEIDPQDNPIRVALSKVRALLGEGE